MKLNKLRENSEFQYEGRKYRVTSTEPPYIYAIKAGDDCEERFNYFELIKSDTYKSLVKVVNEAIKKNEMKKHISVLDTLTKEQRAVVDSRFEMIQPLLILEKAKMGDLKALIQFKEKYAYYIKKGESASDISQENLIDRVSAVYDLSSRTIKRRLAEYRKEETALPNQGMSGLIPKTTKHNFMRKDLKILEICHPKKPDLILDSIRVKLSDECLPFVKKVIEKEYLTLKHDTVKAIYDSIESICLINDITPPQYDTIYKLLSRINPELKSRMREGKVGNERYDEVTRGFSNKEAKYPLHIIEIDHTELDIDVIDERTGLVIGRPYITLGIDVFSRKVWCMEVSLIPPQRIK